VPVKPPSIGANSVSLIFVAIGAILIWFLIAPFLKPSPTTEPQEIDPRVTCALCDLLCDPDEVIEREFGAGRYQFICGTCLVSMSQEYQDQHGSLPTAAPATAEEDETNLG
jgi:hypothetical protein